MVDASDWFEIRSLVAKYNRAFDTGDVESWLETFSTTGVFSSKGQGDVTGHEALREWFATREHTTIHVTADPTIVANGEDEMHHICTVIVFRREEGGGVLSSIGQYEDWLIREPDGWRFRSRCPSTAPVKHL